jgi:hypothetical protein
MTSKMIGIIGATITLCVVGAIAVFALGSYVTPHYDKAAPCDDGAVVKAAENAIEQSPLSRVLHYSIYKLSDVQEIAYDAINDKRTCTAIMFANFGKRELKYTVERLDKSRGKFWVEAQIEDDHEQSK